MSRRVRLLNLSAERIELTLSEPDPTGPFALSSAVRALPPRGALELSLRFAPTQEADSAQELVVGCARGDLSLWLRGRGAAPALSVKLPESQPLPCAPGTLHLGACLVGGTRAEAFSLINETDFDLPYELVPVALEQAPAGADGGGGGGGHAAANERGTVSLEASPRLGVVRARSEQVCTATFSPDLPGLHYARIFEVRVPNARDRKTVILRGHACASAAWLLRPDTLAAELAAPRAAPPGPQLLLSLDGSRAARPLDELSARRIVLLLAPAGAADGGGGGVGGSARLLIGHAPLPGHGAPPAGGEKKAPSAPPVEFSVGALAPDAAALGFSVDVAKGSLAPGQSAAVTFSFAPTSASLGASKLGLIAALGVSQWTEAVVTLSLKGGSPPPAQPEVALVLRGFIPTAAALAEAEARAAAAATEAAAPVNK